MNWASQEQVHGPTCYHNSGKMLYSSLFSSGTVNSLGQNKWLATHRWSAWCQWVPGLLQGDELNSSISSWNKWHLSSWSFPPIWLGKHNSKLQLSGEPCPGHWLTLNCLSRAAMDRCFCCATCQYPSQSREGNDPPSKLNSAGSYLKNPRIATSTNSKNVQSHGFHTIRSTLQVLQLNAFINSKAAFNQRSSSVYQLIYVRSQYRLFLLWGFKHVKPNKLI